MRKAGLKQRSRRKAANGNATNASAKDSAPAAPVSANGTATGAGERRKPTSEEAALTAKNYRLAKELSDLRVRHRDETKTVTRLTMENMNLASRCREAISHVAMLKKELAMHQRRAAEALALQRQQAQRMASTVSDPGTSSGSGNVSDVTASSAVVALEMDRILSAPPPPPPPPKQNQPGVSTPQDQQQSFASFASGGQAAGETGSGEVLSSSGFLRDLSTSNSKSQEPQQSQQPQRRQLRASPPAVDPDEPNAGRDKFEQSPRNLGLTTNSKRQQSPKDMAQMFGSLMDDVPADEMLHDHSSGRLTDLFTSSASPTLPSTPERDDDYSSGDFSSSSAGSSGRNEAYSNSFQTPPGTANGTGTAVNMEPEARPPSPVFPTPTVLKQNRQATPTSSSIDAFEASFDAAFPASFSTPTEEPPPSLDIAFDVPEFSDPFFLGSLDGGGANSTAFPEPSARGTAVGKDDRKREGPANIRSHASVKGSADGNSPPPPPGPPSIQPKNGSPSAVNQGASASAPFDNFSSSSNSLDLFPPSAMSTFELMSEQSLMKTPEKSASDKGGYSTSGEELFRTPPSAFGGADGDVGDSALIRASPPRPEKTGSSAARARYDAALMEKPKGPGANNSLRSSVDQQPLQQTNAKDGSHGLGSDVNHSPTLVLRRLHQRRAKEKASSSPTSAANAPPDRTLGGRSQSASFLRSKSDENTANNKGLNGSHPALDVDKLTPSDEDDFTNHGAGNAAVDDRSAKPRSGPQTSGSRGHQPTESAPSVFQATHPARARGANSLSGTSLSPNSMNEEIRNLDAMAAASTTTPTGAPSSSVKRRNVKQPVSYAEPSLNSKLRRGDVFFPKAEPGSDAGADHEQTSPVSPSSSGSPNMDPSPKHRASKSPEQVLKDLGAPTAVSVHPTAS